MTHFELRPLMEADASSKYLSCFRDNFTAKYTFTVEST